MAPEPPGTTTTPVWQAVVMLFGLAALALGVALAFRSDAPGHDAKERADTLRFDADGSIAPPPYESRLWKIEQRCRFFEVLPLRGVEVGRYGRWPGPLSPDDRRPCAGRFVGAR